MILDIIDDAENFIFRSTNLVWNAIKGPMKSALTGTFLGIGFAIGAEIVRWMQSL